MRKMFIGVLLALTAGCSSKEEAAPAVGIGVIPLSGATVTGSVVEASQPSGVLVKTASDRSFLLPDDWEYRTKGGKTVKVSELAPGTQVTAVAPSREARLVSADGNNLVMETNNDFFSFPVEGLASDAQRAPVTVQAEGGQTWDMPLGQAVSSYPFGIRSHPHYSDYAFPEADRYDVHKGMAVGLYDNSPLFLTPTSGGPGLVRLPHMSSGQNLVGHQPVRFTYADDSVALTSWDSLGDGQFDISDLLLAGTLLDILPGKAVVQVDQRPITVPWEYLTYRGVPVGQQRYPIGTPVGIQYYPGVYDLVSYDHDNATFLYQQQPVQIPIDRLPRDRHRRHRVKVRQPQGQWVSMPFAAAQPLLASGNYWLAPSAPAVRYAQHWEQQRTWKPRPVKGYPGYQLVGHNGHERVVRIDRPRRDQKDSWWTLQPDWSYAVSSLAGPAAWSYADYQRPLVRIAPPYQSPRYDQYPNVAWNSRSYGHKSPGKAKGPKYRAAARSWDYGKHQNVAWSGKKGDWDDRDGARDKKNGNRHNTAWNSGKKEDKHRKASWNNKKEDRRAAPQSHGRKTQPDWQRPRGNTAWNGQQKAGRSQVKHQRRTEPRHDQKQRGRDQAVRQPRPAQTQPQRVSHGPPPGQRVGQRGDGVRQARTERVAGSDRQRQRADKGGASKKITRSTQSQNRWNGGRSPERSQRVASQEPRQQRADKGGGRQRADGKGRKDRR